MSVEMFGLKISKAGVNITTGAASASQSLPANAGGRIQFYRVQVTQFAYVKWGSGAQTASATDVLVSPNEPIVIDASGCDTIAAIQQAAAGSVNVAPIDF